MCTAVLSEAWAKLRDWAGVAGRGQLLLSGSIAHASLITAVCESWSNYSKYAPACAHLTLNKWTVYDRLMND